MAQGRNWQRIWAFLFPAALLLLTACSSPQLQRPADSRAADTPGSTSTGIVVEHVRSVNSGLLLDMRYRIVAPEVAGTILVRGSDIFLQDLATGRKLSVPNMPKIGKLRQLPVNGNDDRIYWMLFNNAGGVVKPGGRVALFIGGQKISEITVE